jgi:dTDP-4-amino-4,6-dideoxygalactose transaminase
VSFGRGKGLTGSGGGALLVNEPAGAAVVQRLTQLPPAGGNARALVTAAAQWLLGRPALYALPSGLPFLRLGDTVYRPPTAPRAMSRVSRAILGVTLTRADQEGAVRRAHAARLHAALAGNKREWVPSISADAQAGYLRFPIVLPPSALERARAARSLGIMPGYPRPLAYLPGFGSRAELPHGKPVGAEHLARHLFTLPTHSLLSERDLVRLEGWLRSLPE